MEKIRFSEKLNKTSNLKKYLSFLPLLKLGEQSI